MKQVLCSAALLYALQLQAQTDCGYQPDVESDFMIGVSDILGILSLFGEVDEDQDGVWDSNDLCLDLDACNFNANPSEDCLYLDAFGVCGGQGVLP
ncbi:MAG: hypothetical protein O2947_08010, partial [Bacteroidetes bacterium]|nr:hypothetical protein [Bacteroidota bacterium]